MSFHSSKPTIVASPALSHISVASWSTLDNVYQQNVVDTTTAILEVLQSPHNTWNYPSPLDVASRVFQPIVPQSPELVWPALDNVEDFPFLNVPDSPNYILTSAPISPAPNNSLNVLAPTSLPTSPPIVKTRKRTSLLQSTQIFTPLHSITTITYFPANHHYRPTTAIGTTHA